MSKNKQALIFYGGWEGHQPGLCARRFNAALEAEGFKVTCVDHQDILEDLDQLKTFDLITPIWTMGDISEKAESNLRQAVSEGSGLGGFHGGMGDAFRKYFKYQWMVGGQFVEHPKELCTYPVRLTREQSPITQGMPPVFEYHSEIYHMMVDPAIRVLAEATYTDDSANGPYTVPMVWTKHWGQGRVFFSSFGHQDEEFERYPEVFAMTLRGMVWASR